jgi:hypothetical protein
MRPPAAGEVELRAGVPVLKQFAAADGEPAWFTGRITRRQEGSGP